MASISSVITGGFGTPGSAALVITDGYGTSGVAPPVVVPTPSAGVRRARFLRRAPKLPWEHEDEPAQDVVLSKPRRKRIPLPEAKALQAVSKDVPVQLYREIPQQIIAIPDMPVSVDDDDDDEVLWLI